MSKSPLFIAALSAMFLLPTIAETSAAEAQRRDGRNAERESTDGNSRRAARREARQERRQNNNSAPANNGNQRRTCQ